MSSFPIIFKAPPNGFDSMIGKFDEKINLLEQVQPIKMYWKSEDIINEDIDPTVEIDYRKKKRKRNYKSTSTLIIEDSADSGQFASSSTPVSFKYEGKFANLKTEGALDVPDTTLKYIQLVLCKTLIGGKEVPQVLATPVRGTINNCSTDLY